VTIEFKSYTYETLQFNLILQYILCVSCSKETVTSEGWMLMLVVCENDGNIIHKT
jgi:hypothetical protein